MTPEDARELFDEAITLVKETASLFVEKADANTVNARFGQVEIVVSSGDWANLKRAVRAYKEAAAMFVRVTREAERTS